MTRPYDARCRHRQVGGAGRTWQAGWRCDLRLSCLNLNLLAPIPSFSPLPLCTERLRERPQGG
jgi:hypothetical protein